MNKFSLFISSAIIISAFAANAGSGKHYFKLELGAAKAMKFDKANYGNNRPKTNGVGALSYGHNFNKHVASEVGITQFSEFKVSGSRSSTSRFEQKIDASAFMLNAILNAPNYNGFTPYATFGMGMAYVAADDYSTRTASGTAGVQSGKSKINPAFNAGAGVKYDLTNDLTASLVYKFNYLGDSSTSRVITASNGGTAVGAPVRAKIKTHSLLMGVAYKF